MVRGKPGSDEKAAIGRQGLRWLDDRLRQFEARRKEWRKRPYTICPKPELHPLIPGLWDLRERRRKGHSSRGMS